MKKLRAFVVEDSPIILESLVDALEAEADVEIVGSANSERDALAWFDARDDGCDVAIIDIFLHEGNGLGILEHMRGYTSPPSRVVLTNYATREMRSRCASLGADVTFDKSTELEEMLSWLKAARRRPIH